MKYFFGIMILLCKVNAGAQNPLIVNGGEKGLFILNPFKVASVQFPDNKTVGFKLERSDNNGNAYQTITVFATPSTTDAFKLNLQRAAVQCVLPGELNESEITDCWMRFSRYHKLDSIRQYLSNQQLLMALNLLLLDETAKPGQNYIYRLSALDASGGIVESKTSSPVFCPAVMRFAQPRFYNYEISQQQIVLNFKSGKAGKTPNHFAVYRKQTNAQGSFTRVALSRDIVKEKDSLLFTFYDRNVSDAVTYFYCIAPSDQFGNYNIVSDTAAASLLESKDVLIPSNFKATGNDSADAIQLSWNLINPEAIGSVQLYRCTEYNGEYALINTFNPYETDYTDKGISQGIKYYYYLKITDKFSRNSINGARIFGIVEGVEKPNTVAVMHVVAESGKVKIEWVPNGSNIRGFRVYKTFQIEGTLEPVGGFIDFKEGTELYAVHDTVKNTSSSSVIGYTVVQENNAHIEGTAYPLQYVVNDLQSVSQTLQIGVDARAYSNKVLITWTNLMNTRVSGYNIYRRNVETGRSEKLNTTVLLPNVLSYCDSTPVKSGTQVYAIEPVMMNGKPYRMFESGETAILPDPPQSPYDLRLSVNGNAVTITWDYYNSEKNVKFDIYRWIAGEDPVKVGTTESGIKKYNETVPAGESAAVLYFVKAVNEAGESKPSKTIELIR